MVADGHLGVDAAVFIEAHFHRTLYSLIPPKLPDWENRKEVEAYAEILRRALCDTFVHIENQWLGMGHIAGSTVTIVLITGRLLTAANVGDSAAVLDTGCSLLELTDSHRIQDHVKEKARLLAAGCNLAQLGFHLQGPARPKEPGVGPLRIWPGGLCVSRSIGDSDAGPEIVPLPHVKQVLIPEQGCRVIMASDGLWDILSLSKAVKIARPKPTESAASTLVNSVMRDLRFNDDTTVIVIDALPTPTSNFPTIALQMALHPDVLQRRKPKSGLCACLQTENDEPSSHETSMAGPGHLPLFADMDSLKAYPHLLHELIHKSHLVSKDDDDGDGVSDIGLLVDHGMVAPDYTVHAGSEAFYQQRRVGAPAVVNLRDLSDIDGPSNYSGPLTNKCMPSSSILTPHGSEVDPESTVHSENRFIEVIQPTLGRAQSRHVPLPNGTLSPGLTVTHENLEVSENTSLAPALTLPINKSPSLAQSLGQGIREGALVSNSAPGN